MEECLTRDRGAAGSSLTGVTALWSLSKNNNPSLVLVQPRKIRRYITERLFMGRKESNQTNKQNHHGMKCDEVLIYLISVMWSGLSFNPISFVLS